MANTYDTSEYPLGSTDPKVLYNNASNFDDAMNAFVDTWPDRFQRARKTWFGFEQDFNNFLINSGFEPLHLTYVDGSPLVVNRPTQLIDRGSSVYRVKMPAVFPVNLTGNWATDQNLLVDVGDQPLRSQLASASGAGMIGFINGQTVEQRLGKQVLSTDYPFVKAACDANLNVLIPPGTHVVTTLITVRDNQTITFMPGAILTQGATGNAGIFNFPAGVKNVKISGPGILRGPAYGRTPAPAPVYPQSNGAIRMTGTAANPISYPSITDITIEGWDDYGIFSENCIFGKFNNMQIRDIGRDGIRLYGPVLCQTNGNFIDNIAPGFGGAGANLNVYGITYTRRADAGGSPATNPPPQYCEAVGNMISNCRTWKGLDTHGGRDLLFANNVILHCHIAIGIDEGDTVSVNDAPPQRIKVTGNILTRGLGNAGGAGINMSSSNATNMGIGNELTSNTIRGFGGVSTGGINIAYQLYPQVNNNQILDCTTSGINIPSGVRVTGFRFTDNTIKNTLADGATPALAAIAVQAVEAAGVIDGLTLIRDTGILTGISLVSPSAGYGIKLGGEIDLQGTITMYAANARARVMGGSTVTNASAYCRVTSAGVLGDNYGVASVSRVSAGVYNVVLSVDGLTTTDMCPIPNRRSTSPGDISALPTSLNTIQVLTWNQAGAPTDTEFGLVVHGR